jgi:hypothetical protein
MLFVLLILCLACMRMRKLGQGQSVVFCAPTDIKRKILECSGKWYGDVEVADVLKWCISETYTYTRNSIPLWATQGVRYQNHSATRSQTSDSERQNFPVHVAEALLEVEAKSLEDRYGCTEVEEGAMVQLLKTMNDSGMLDAIRAKCREFELTSFSNATLQEEQERELSPENEREQQVELPPPSKPHIHTIHEELKRLVRGDIFNRSPHAFRPAFESLGDTSAIQGFETGVWPKDLLVTTDFARTIQAPRDQLLDSFLRPVHWLISRKNGDKVEIVIVSPYEAQELLPSIKQMKAVSLHIYAPRLSSSMRILEDLSFCAIPSVPKVWAIPPVVMQLNLFAGQLYLRSYEEYVSLCNFLGLCSHPPDMDVKVACDGFISPATRGGLYPTTAGTCSFTTSPVNFLRIVTALRRKGQSYALSHMGIILYCGLITREAFSR